MPRFPTTMRSAPTSLAVVSNASAMSLPPGVWNSTDTPWRPASAVRFALTVSTSPRTPSMACCHALEITCPASTAGWTT